MYIYIKKLTKIERRQTQLGNSCIIMTEKKLVYILYNKLIGGEIMLPDIKLYYKGHGNQNSMVLA